MGESKTLEDVTDVPKGLDIVLTAPGTIVGGHDVQGTDGTTRTDRPGELLGTPIAKSKNDPNSIAQGDYVRQEVDRANREELPRLGGKADDGWTAGDARPATSAEEAGVAATVRAEAAAPAKSGVVVSPKIDRG